MLKSCLHDDVLEAGCDEAGRGCLAGPVFAASVILPPGYRNERLNDSKKLNRKTRYELRSEIEEQALAYAVAQVDNEMIDEINILKASIKAMHKAIDLLGETPEHILVDGNRFFPYQKIPHTCVVKGDGKYYSIAAASVLAKTYRDDYMLTIHQEYSEYGWNKNMGYPTKEHRRAIVERGLTKYHRKTFRVSDDQLKIDFQ